MASLLLWGWIALRCMQLQKSMRAYFTNKCTGLLNTSMSILLWFNACPHINICIHLVSSPDNKEQLAISGNFTSHQLKCYCLHTVYACHLRLHVFNDRYLMSRWWEWMAFCVPWQALLKVISVGGGFVSLQVKCNHLLKGLPAVCLIPPETKGLGCLDERILPGRITVSSATMVIVYSCDLWFGLKDPSCLKLLKPNESRLLRKQMSGDTANNYKCSNQDKSFIISG